MKQRWDSPGELRKIAAALTARGIPTAHGGTWTSVQASDILRRAERL